MGLRDDIERLKLMGCDGVYTDELECHLASEEADKLKQTSTPSKKKKCIPVALRKKQKQK